MIKKDLNIIEPYLNYKNFKINLKIKKYIELVFFIISVLITFSLWYYNPKTYIEINSNFIIKKYQFWIYYLTVLYLIIYVLSNIRYLITKYYILFKQKNKLISNKLKIYFKENEYENNELPFSVFYLTLLNTFAYTDTLNFITYILFFVILYMTLNNIYELIVGIFLGDLNICRNLHISYNKLKYEDNSNN